MPRREINWQLVRLPANGPDACKCLDDPIFDGNTYRARIQVGTSVEAEPMYYWVIECLYATQDVSVPYSEDHTPMRCSKGEYICCIWKSSERVVHVVTGTKENIYEELGKRLREVTKNDKVQLRGMPWNIIRRDMLWLLKPLVTEIERNENAELEKKYRLIKAMNNRKTPEQHWRQFAARKERGDD